MKITLAQINPKIGDLELNAVKILVNCKKAADQESDLIVFPECALTGYPVQDLLLYPAFLEKVSKYIALIMLGSKAYPKLAIAVGTPVLDDSGLYNSVIVVKNGQYLFRQDKSNLPNYDVFDEKRYFIPSTKQEIFNYLNKKIVFSICEDLWGEDSALNKVNKQNYSSIVNAYKSEDIDILINLSASPFEQKKQIKRQEIFQLYAKALNCPVLMVNQIAGNDQLIFDGASLVYNSNAQLVRTLQSFEEDFETFDLNDLQIKTSPERSDIQDLHDALLLGIRDYLRKTGFKKVIVSLSGGIDSAVTAALAVAALGPDQVLSYGLPSQFSSQGSIDDAKALAENLGIDFELIDIHSMYDEALALLSPQFKHLEQDETEENIQARIRGLFIMAIANKFNALVLNTGNKSELAMGYCTLYGDMCGALAVLADVYKSDVYLLADFINNTKEVIPINTINKAPSAELRPNQKDSDSLPDYELLDQIINYYIDERLAADEIILKGFDKQLVQWILKRIDMNEYKRQQVAQTLRVSKVAFGIGRRMPIAASYSF